MHFCCSELILVTLTKQTKTTFVNLRGAFICFILCHTILSSKVFPRFENIVLIEQLWDSYQLIGLIFSFFRSLVEDQPAPQSLWDFHCKQGKKRFPNFSQNFTKEKHLSNQNIRCARTSYAMPILLCFSDVFLHFKNAFVSHVWEVNNCTA